MKEKVSIFWFRRDLRLQDNRGLSKALASGANILPIFIFDTDILDKLEDKYDRRVDYIQQVLSDIDRELKSKGSGITILYGAPKKVFADLLVQYNIGSVFCNKDYEPYAIQRDLEIRDLLSEKGVIFLSYKDQVIFEEQEVVKDDKTPYTVYTPYSRKWKNKLLEKDFKEIEYDLTGFLRYVPPRPPSLEDLGFEKTDIEYTSPRLNASIIRTYDQHRDFPAKDQTTRLGIALRFGTISIRKCVDYAIKHNTTWLSELIWREFFMQILFHFPNVANQCFKEKYESISWRNNEEEFKLWCEGNTGYPIVDAGMRQLNKTGFMHNRVRMVTASFLCKHLLIDWRWGEAYFAKKLNDYDLSANNGNWQWAAGCGCDAAPYFRVFNPSEQTKRFDKDLVYIKKWNPDFENMERQPIVDHKKARERAMKVYKEGLNN